MNDEADFMHHVYDLFIKKIKKNEKRKNAIDWILCAHRQTHDPN